MHEHGGVIYKDMSNKGTFTPLMKNYSPPPAAINFQWLWGKRNN